MISILLSFLLLSIQGVSYAADCPAVSAPTGVSASDGTYTDKVRLIWDTASGATSYEVYRSASLEDTNMSYIGSPATNAYDDTSVSPNTLYYYRVRSSNGCSVSDYSEQDPGYSYCPAVSAPTGVSASDGTYTDRVRLIWDTVSGATSYNVYRSASLEGTMSQIGTTATNSYDDTSGSPGKVYYYWIRSSNGCSVSDYSEQDPGYSYCPAVSAPTGVSASDGTYTDRVRLIWDTVSGATSYEVYRSASLEDTNMSYIGTTGTNAYDDTSVSSGTVYYYRVRSSNGCSMSDYSEQDPGYSYCPAVSAPTGVSASDGTYTDKVRLIWDTTSGATSYNVYRSSSLEGTMSQIGTTATNSYDDTSISPNTLYYYRVRSSNGCSMSDYSDQDAGYSYCPAVSAPTGVSASDGTYTDRVRLIWDTVSGATSYEVYRSASLEGTMSQIGTTATNSYDDTSGSPGKVYYYWIRSSNGCSVSDYSAYDTGFMASPEYVAVFRDGWWYLDSNGIPGWNEGDVSMKFGLKTDVPIAGDWNGDGVTDVGVFRDGWWYLDSNGIPGWNEGDVSMKFGLKTDVPIAGDWNGDGVTDVGVFRDGWWYLDSNGIPGWNEGDVSMKFGLKTDVPTAGDWNGDGVTDVGVFRDGWWYLDSNGIPGWNEGDVSMKFGISYDIPLSGIW